MKLRHQTVLITGGTSGIGHALASLLLEQGDTVLITGRTEGRLEAARRTLNGVHTFVCDQADPAAITRLHAEVQNAFPNLSVLINNAGIGLKRNLNQSIALAELESEIRTNLIGPIQMVQQFLPQLKRQDRALIVNVTSGLAFVPMPLKPIYCATKAAVHSYTQSLRVQLKHSSVRVVELAPPATRTDFNKGQEDMNSAQLMEAEDVARICLRDLEAGRDEILPGASKALRAMGRLKPRATLRTEAAEQLGLEA